MTTKAKYQEIDHERPLAPTLQQLLSDLVAEAEIHERRTTPRGRKRSERARANLKQSFSILMANVPDDDAVLIVPRGAKKRKIERGDEEFRRFRQTWNQALDLLHSMKLIYLRPSIGGTFVAEPTKVLRERLALAAQSAPAS